MLLMCLTLCHGSWRILKVLPSRNIQPKLEKQKHNSNKKLYVFLTKQCTLPLMKNNVKENIDVEVKKKRRITKGFDNWSWMLKTGSKGEVEVRNIFVERLVKVLCRACHARRMMREWTCQLLIRFQIKKRKKRNIEITLWKILNTSWKYVLYS